VIAETKPAVVAIGGGRGLSATLSAAKPHASRLTGIVASADDSGSTGRLRRGLNISAPGDIRRCLTAMSDRRSDALARAFEYRFEGSDVEGHALGNLVIAAFSAGSSDFSVAINQVSALLGIDPNVGRLYSATERPSTLAAITREGRRVTGQYAISQTQGVERVWLEPSVSRAPAAAVEAIRTAQHVLIGPGSLFTSVLAAVLAPGISEALEDTTARCTYICNTSSSEPETLGYSVNMHIERLAAHGLNVDVALVASDGLIAQTGVMAGVPAIHASLCGEGGESHDAQKFTQALKSILLK